MHAVTHRFDDDDRHVGVDLRDDPRDHHAQRVRIDSGAHVDPQRLEYTGHLTTREVHHGWRLAFNGRMLRVRHHADDLDGITSGPAEPEAFPNRAVEPKLARETFVYHNDWRRIRHVAVRERSPAPQRNTEGIEVAGTDCAPCRAGVDSRRRVDTFYRESPAQREVVEQRNRRGADAAHARLRGKGLLDAIVENRHSSGIVCVQMRRDAEAHDRVDVHAEILAANVHEAAREQPSEHEQYHRERDLRRRQCTAKTHRATTARRPRCMVHRPDRTRVTNAPCRGEAEYEYGHERRQGCGHRRSGAEREVQHDIVRQHSGEHSHDECGNQQAQDAADCDQHERLDQQLENELTAARANRRANGHLARPSRTAREQQVRHVHADDQKHEHRDSEQQLERPRCRGRYLALPACARRERDTSLAEALQGSLERSLAKLLPAQRGSFDLVQYPAV